MCWLRCRYRSLSTHSLCVGIVLVIPTHVCVAKTPKYVWLEVIRFLWMIDDVTANMDNDMDYMDDVSNDMPCSYKMLVTHVIKYVWV